MITGGCQCGSVRYAVERLGRSSVCHCVMCRRAFGGFYAPLVVAEGLRWTSSAPAYFQSSNLSKRGFCAVCGTPLSLENLDDDLIELATGTLDDPELAPPTIQINHSQALGFTDAIGSLGTPDAAGIAENKAWNDTVISYQRRGAEAD